MAETPRQTAERLAAATYPNSIDDRNAYIIGYMDRDAEPFTASAEQIEKAAIFGFESPDYNDMSWSKLPEFAKQRKREYMARLFRAVFEGTS